MKSTLRNAVLLGSLALSGCNESAEPEVAPLSATKRLDAELDDQSTKIQKLFMDVIDEKEKSIRRLSGKESFHGTGIGIQEKNGQTIVYNVFTGSPAEDAGLAVGDILAKIDGTDLTGLSVNQVQEMMTSKNAHSNKIVKVSVIRNGQVFHFDVAVKHMRIVPRVEIIDQE
jgi:C-terminal processing protease CtpA/Prc